MRLSATKTGSANQYRGLGNQLWDLAGNRPSLDLPFADSKSLVDATTGTNLVDHTRASSATYVGSDGLIKTAVTNVPRFDHDPTTGESLGLLVEESRTNLVQKSKDFTVGSGGYWNTVGDGLTITLNQATAPDGTNTATLAEVPAGSGAKSLQYFAGTATVGQAYTSSMFAKADTWNYIRIEVTGGGVLGYAAFDLSNGSFVAEGNSPDSYGIENIGNGWYRIWVTNTAVSAVGYAHRFVLCADNGLISPVTVGGTVYLWGAQLEAGAFPTSYIPTEGSTVTRAADVATDTTRGAALRTLYAQFRSPASGTRPIVSVDDNTTNERIELFTSGTDPKLLITDGGSAQADLDAGAITASTTAQLAARFNTDNFAASISGGAEVTDTSGTMPTVDRIRIGRDQAGNYLNGPIARITGWDVALPMLPPITG